MFKHIRQPEASETPQPWDFSGVLHLDLTWLKPKWNAWNNRTGFVSLWDPFQVWQSRECFHPAKAFQKQQDWLSDRIACYTIIYCFSSFQMNWAFYWVKKNHTVVTDSASYTGCAVTRRGTVAESTSLKLCSMSYPSLSWIMPHILWMWIHLLTNSASAAIGCSEQQVCSGFAVARTWIFRDLFIHLSK